jgi:RNA polymerase sigma factor (sigma-70 family)
MREGDDNALLRQYVECGSEEAFAGLVTRHIDKVHSVALRHTRNPHQAEEITEAVFAILATKARHLRKWVILSGWFYQTARLTAVTFLRSEMRRAHREHEAHLQAMLNENEADAWVQIGPWLDAAMAGLNELDRHAVVLRFFDGKSMQEVGTVLGASEEAAKKRVNRAVEKMRLFFAKRGVALSTAVLTAAISANSVQAAPAALAKSVIAAGLAKGAASGISTVILLGGALKFMAWTKLNLGLTALLMAGVATTFVMQRQAQTKLFAENASLREHIAQLQSENTALSAGAAAPKRTPRMPAPRVQPAAATALAPADVSLPANLYARLFKDGNETRLTLEQLQPYLEANDRNSGSLLAAFRATGDPSLLHEALQKYPNDPQVNFAGAVSKDLSPEDHRQALDAFKKADPDNALANHLSALSYFNSGQSDQAVQELIAAAGKPRFEDYSRDFVQNAAEAYLAAGYPAAEAKTLSTTGLSLPQLGDLRQLGQDMVSLAASYRQANDEASAQATLQIAANLGQSYRNASSEQLVGQLVGMQIEKSALTAMSPASPYGDPGQTVQDRLNQLAQQKASLNDLTRQMDPIMQNMSDQDWISFNDRLMVFGEEPAMRWLAQKHRTN